MIETALTLLAKTFTTTILPKAIEAIGKKVGESAFDQGTGMIKKCYQLVRQQLTQTNSLRPLERVENNLTPSGVQVLEAELVVQMEEDESFAQALQESIEECKTEIPELQTILENADIKGKLNMGEIDIENEGKAIGKQSIGKGLKVGKNATFKKITIKNKGL